MSLHPSLKTKPAGLNQHRNVLTRAERIEKLADENKFEMDSTSPMGLPKVASRKVKIAGKPTGEEATAEGEEAEVTETTEEANGE
jgi:small basic protein (TIGR04137 family)